MKLSRHLISHTCVLILLYWSIWCSPSAAETARNDIVSGRVASLAIGISPHVFYNVDPKDVVKLMEVWVRILDKKFDDRIKSTITVFNAIEEAEKALSKNEVDILVMIPEEFVRLRTKYHLTAILSADYGKHFYNDLFLLVPNGGGITHIEQLRGRKMIIDVGQQGSIPIKWLDSLLTAQGASNAQGFFSQIIASTKSSQAILPVFFGQADSCLVGRAYYETMSEMNPQIGRKLRVLEKSPGFVAGIIASRKDLKKVIRDTIVENLSGMHADPRGKQIMTLFRINRLVPFAPEHLTSIEKIIRERRGKTDSAPNRKIY